MNDLRIFERDGKILVNSRDVARNSGKRPDHVLRDIDNILKNPTAPNLGWFILALYVDEKGEKRRSFDMTIDGFTLVGFGWNGPRWIQAKIEHLQEFNRMKEELARRGQGDSLKLAEEIKLLKHQLAILTASYPKASIGDVTCDEAIRELGYGGPAWMHFRKCKNPKLGYKFRKLIPRAEWTHRGSPAGPWAFPRSQAMEIAEIVHLWAKEWGKPDDPAPEPSGLGLNSLPLFANL